ncbi:MAG TPA: response regulator transcription factor [Candidatus Mediterraneibacter intestinigallinarum]|nr:response regulator transcription factor [Candidatus Mediterraneibacter intestinigallinarum]
MEQILIAEDDEKIAQLEKDYLESSGYGVAIIKEGKKVIPELMKHDYNLVLLDIMLPGCSGYDICRTIREEIDIPILMVTARAEAVDVIRGLGLGADDYITKPFDPSQLVARVRSHLKRYERLTAGRDSGKRQTSEPERIVVDDVVIEPRTWKVWKNGNELKLPNREFELLRFLAENPNIVFSKEELFEKIWGYDYISDAATVSVHINRLREKIEDDARNPKIIETVWGAGYRLNM